MMRMAAIHARCNSTGRRIVGAGLLLACGVAAGAQARDACTRADWPLWHEFVAGFVQDDGRVLDASTPQQHSTSEGQSYAMFFALVANDPAAFERLWKWSKDNLMSGAGSLPAWQWGRSSDGSWRVLDPNSASDADLWFSYALLEAGRLWKRADYTRDATRLMHRVASEEVVQLPGMGAMLLPGRDGFAQPERLWRLNPSYLPLPVLRRLQHADPQGPWQEIAAGTARMYTDFATIGLVPDWHAYQADTDDSGRFVVDPVKGATGGYDAIRSYLWAGMDESGDALARQMLKGQYGMAAITARRGVPPETVDAGSGSAQGDGPLGFSAALLPYLQATGNSGLLQQQRERVSVLLRQARADSAREGRQLPYYDYMLGLFGLGWIEQRYRFAGNGMLRLPWESTCVHATTR